MGDRIPTIGFIGNGKGTRRCHMPLSLALPEKFCVKTVYAPHPCGSWPEVPGIEHTTDLDAMLADPGIDVVEISSPHATHCALARQTLETGRHVVCDRAVVGAVVEAKGLFALAESKGVTVRCYQDRRFDSDHLTARKVAESGMLGRVCEVVTHYGCWREAFSGWRARATSGRAPLRKLRQKDRRSS